MPIEVWKGCPFLSDAFRWTLDEVVYSLFADKAPTVDKISVVKRSVHLLAGSEDDIVPPHTPDIKFQGYLCSLTHFWLRLQDPIATKPQRKRRCCGDDWPQVCWSRNTRTKLVGKGLRVLVTLVLVMSLITSCFILLRPIVNSTGTSSSPWMEE